MSHFQSTDMWPQKCRSRFTTLTFHHWSKYRRHAQVKSKQVKRRFIELITLKINL